ncbi:outer membrane protein [Frigidibacter sp. ROC022]|uniref:outer membrane protein n=1 Tax=Frigidibacter sp. ROC022 TaxID=2971796 RepID=UPI00215A8EC4|nr:porin family protein [Frigidibacter sp. ROC022]MCR8724730.1 porin family protein [Frigidibacter sp. ROC022]
MKRHTAAALAALMLTTASPALAEVELSFYLGSQEAAHSRVRGNDPGGLGDFNELIGWQGKSFAMPPYYGVRATWWKSDRLGFALEFNHAKVYAPDSEKAAAGFTTLEFTDGINIFTGNVMYRFPNDSAWTPYVGAGLGISVPHVEVTTSGGRTFNYQIGGPAATLIGGVSYAFNDKWAMFGEYKMTYSRNDVDLDNGGYLKTNIVTNALNLGISYKF